MWKRREAMCWIKKNMWSLDLLSPLTNILIKLLRSLIEENEPESSGADVFMTYDYDNETQVQKYPCMFCEHSHLIQRAWRCAGVLYRNQTVNCWHCPKWPPWPAQGEVADPDHPLHKEFRLLPSRLRDSFVPAAIRHFNDLLWLDGFLLLFYMFVFSLLAGKQIAPSC